MGLSLPVVCGIIVVHIAEARLSGIWFILLAAALVSIVLMYYRGFVIPRLQRRHSIEIEKVSAQRIEQSKAVTRGLYTEQLAPFLPNFPYHPSDARFLGSPVDFIVFDGMSEGDIKRIVISEIKTGKSQLTTRQRHIKKLVQAGNVEFDVFRIDDHIDI